MVIFLFYQNCLWVSTLTSCIEIHRLRKTKLDALTQKHTFLWNFYETRRNCFSMHASTIHFGSILTYFMTLSAWKCMQEALALNTFTTSQISSTVIDYFLRYLISDIASCHPLETSLNLSWIWYTSRVNTIRIVLSKFCIRIYLYNKQMQ